MELLKDFQWWRYPGKTCRLEAARRWPNPNFGKKPVGTGFGFVELDGSPAPRLTIEEKMRALSAEQEWCSTEERIIPAGGTLEPYPPLKHHQGQVLLLQFIKIRDGKSALWFVNQYGPVHGLHLHDVPNYAGEPTKPLIDTAAEYRALLHHHNEGETANFRKALGNGKQERMAVTLRPSPSAAKGKAVFSLEAPSLSAVLFVQLAQALAGDTTLRQCRNCPTWFEAGPGLKRNKKAAFCTEECKKRWFSKSENRNRSSTHGS